jgi:hypothetical protein
MRIIGETLWRELFYLIKDATEEELRAFAESLEEQYRLGEKHAIESVELRMRKFGRLPRG